MRITEIGVTYHETASLPGYSNVKPGVSLTASVEEGEDPEKVRQELMTMARTQVHDLIDDALEKQGEPPKYYNGPRYKVVRSREASVVAVLPENAETPDTYVTLIGSRGNGFRLDYSLKYGKRQADFSGHEFVDASDGDLSGLPTPSKETPKPQEPDYEDEDDEDDDEEEEDYL